MPLRRPVMTNALQFAPGNGVGYHSLKLNGGAVDAGSNSVYPVNPLGQLDAIGNPRLIEGNGDGIITIDLGAVEYLVNTPVALFSATPNPTGLNEPVSFNGSASTHPNPAAGSIVSWEWDFDWNPNQPSCLTNPITIQVLHSGCDRINTPRTRTPMQPHVLHRPPDCHRQLWQQRVSSTRLSPWAHRRNQSFQRPFSVTTDLTPTISWTGSPAKYGLKVDKVIVVNSVVTSRTNVINLSNLSSTTYTPSSNLALGRYEVTSHQPTGSGTTTSNSVLLRRDPNWY